jgi:hypothetical protein
MGNYIPNDDKIPQWTKKCPLNKTYVLKYQIPKNYTKLFRFKDFKNKPKLGFLVCKYTIWQPWPKIHEIGAPAGLIEILGGPSLDPADLLENGSSRKTGPAAGFSKLLHPGMQFRTQKWYLVYMYCTQSCFLPGNKNSSHGIKLLTGE